jgi:Tol biopolymer transport system component
MASTCDEQSQACAARRLTYREGLDSFPLWSPDGQQIVFTSNFDVYVMDADGSHLHQLVRNELRDQFLTWRP